MHFHLVIPLKRSCRMRERWNESGSHETSSTSPSTMSQYGMQFSTILIFFPIIRHAKLLSKLNRKNANRKATEPLNIIAFHRCESSTMETMNFWRFNENVFQISSSGFDMNRKWMKERESCRSIDLTTLFVVNMQRIKSFFEFSIVSKRIENSARVLQNFTSNR